MKLDINNDTKLAQKLYYNRETKKGRYDFAEPLLTNLGFVKLGLWGFRIVTDTGSNLDYYPTTCTIVLSGKRKAKRLSLDNFIGVYNIMNQGYYYKDACNLYFKEV